MGNPEHSNDIAIIGLNGRFPGAEDVSRFWQNLRDGVESITFFSAEEDESLEGDRPALNSPQYVRAAPMLEKDIGLFDNTFFGFSPREAEIMDPQQRLFLESAWEVLESAGYDTETYKGRIGVYAGVSFSTYLMFYLSLPRGRVGLMENMHRVIRNDKDYLATTVSYKLNLKGPSVTVQTACSTALVAVHFACQSLLNHECDLALAGAVRIVLPQKSGYMFYPDGILSPDGHCRAFDADAQGTIFGNGLGVVALKRLPDAVAEGDCIHAVIKGSAINNDGSTKVGFTAPGFEGQREVISETLSMAAVPAETITYIETHGTGTPLGDPIEIAALTAAFREFTAKKQFCAIGSVKTNIGHLEEAAGIASLIKTIMALKHRLLPPSLHFVQPNPRIDFGNSPFYVNTALSEWKTNGAPRRAGISSFGIGGTNAHVVLEEAPDQRPSGPSRPWQLLLLSAKTASALKEMTSNLAGHLEANPDLSLPDVAYTLQVGRRAFPHRRVFLAQSAGDAATALMTLDAHRAFTAVEGIVNRPVAFMFPGQGAQYPNMGRALYENEPVFRSCVDRCSELLASHLHLDLRRLLYPAPEQSEQGGKELNQTAIAQPALFVIEYALAQLWMSWGVQPVAMIGHSIGEYVAACLADVFSLEDALRLVAARGRLMQKQPAGAMIAVNLSEPDTRAILGSSLSLAAVNAPQLCVVSGPADSVGLLEQLLAARDVGYRRLHTSHAFHSAMMEPAIEPFEVELRKVTLRPPRIPFVSNVTAQWITAAQATDFRYWADHLRQPVWFGDGVRVLLEDSNRALLEVGPGQTLAGLARQQFREEERVILSSTPHPQQQQSEVFVLLTTLARLWLRGVHVDWPAYSAHERRYRVPLPSYPFERRRYWIDWGGQPDAPSPAADLFGQRTASPARKTQEPLGKLPDVADWFYRPVWKDAAIPTASAAGERTGSWLAFTDTSELSRQLVERMREKGNDVITVLAGDRFQRFDNHTYTIDPRRREDYAALLEDVRGRQKLPLAIAHLWNVSQRKDAASRFDESEQYLGFYSLLFLTQAIAKRDMEDSVYLGVVTSQMQRVREEDTVYPSRATVLGPCLVIPLEYPKMRCCSVDIEASDSAVDSAMLDELLVELDAKGPDPIVAYRRKRRWVPTFDRIRLDRPAEASSGFRKNGVYLITGGLGGLGLAVAEYLARTVQAKLVLIGRSPLPVRSDWEQWLAAHDADDGTSQRIRTVQNLEKHGAEVLMAQADVADSQQMQEAIDQATRQFGTLHGVIHAAGVLHDGLIEHKTYDAAAGVLAPKVGGGLVLDALLRDAKLDFMAFFSSISAVTGRLGQVDYVAANAFLDALATSRMAAQDRLTVSINWDGWQEVGMAAEIATRLRTGEKQLPSKTVTHPLLKESTEESGRSNYRARLRVAEQWVLDEHRIAGQAVLPGTGCLEMARAAFADLTGASVMEVRNFAFTSPMVVADAQEKEVRAVLQKEGDVFNVTIEAKSQSGQYQGREWQPHAYGEIAVADSIQPSQLDLKALENRCHGEWINVDETRHRSSFETTEITFGPRWRSLKQLKWSDQEGLAMLELPDAYASDVEAFGLHPALLDVALGWPALVIGGGVQLPLFYERVRVFGRIPTRLYSYARQRRSDGVSSELLTFDVTLMDEEGRVIVDVEGYNIRRVTDEILRQVAGAATRAAMESTIASDSRAGIREDENLSLEIPEPGLLESLRWGTANRRQPQEGEVEIEVYATGLNFLDVLSALGLRPRGADDQMGLGCECAGRIVALGPGIEDFQVGDEVIAVTASAFSRYVTTSLLLVARKPARFSFEEAATIPITFLTAHYALQHAGRLQPGERVLIQAAAGGVGLAAVQLAQRIGAEIFATAGSEKKRAFLRSLGIQHVMDSRSLAFADDVMAATNGQGVDVVLNSLAGEFIPKGLSILSSFGRFLEIGKRDIYQGSQLNLLPFAKNLSFSAIDLLRVAFERPEFLNRLFSEVMQYFEEGTLRPLPLETFPFTKAASAFEYMADSKQIGKVVVLRPDAAQLAALGPAVARHDNAVGRRQARPSMSRSPHAAFNPIELELKQGILSEEGFDALERILSHSLPQVVVSTRDLTARISRSAGRIPDLVEPSVSAPARHPRPALETPYVAPRNELEVAISEIWKTHLGIESVGVHDNFFELGGDSLLAVQVVARVSKRLQVDVPLSSLWEVQTVAGVAEALRQRDPKLGETAAMASLIEQSGAPLSPTSSAAGSSDEKEEGVI
jgi:acyl transferase domain-containing protein/acyl carrier protein